jgi:hypothetical protein
MYGCVFDSNLNRTHAVPTFCSLKAVAFHMSPCSSN